MESKPMLSFDVQHCELAQEQLDIHRIEQQTIGFIRHGSPHGLPALAAGVVASKWIDSRERCGLPPPLPRNPRVKAGEGREQAERAAPSGRHIRARKSEGDTRDMNRDRSPLSGDPGGGAGGRIFELCAAYGSQLDPGPA